MADDNDTFEASRADKLRRIEELGLDPWGQRFDGHQSIAAIRALPSDQPEDQRPRVKAAGRILLRRGQGKAYFVDIRDWTGKVQVMIGQKQVGEQGWALAQNLDLGDLIGVEGHFGKTRMGEPTIFIDQRRHPDDKLTFLGKSLQPHPDKHGGMQDMEFRLRHRYLDLIYNEDMLGRALKRVQIIRRIRSYLEDKGYCEVETPTLHAIAGGAAAKPFITHHNALDFDLYLRIALELHLKRLLVGGIEKVYEIGRVFRNEGISPKHNPEFTMLELYQAYGNYETMMDLTEGLIITCVQCLAAGTVLPFGDKTIDFTPPWQRKPYAELFREHVGVAMDDVEGVRDKAAQARIPLEVKTPVEKTPVANVPPVANAPGSPGVAKDHDVLVHELFEHKVEDKLVGPVFVHDYPAKLCPLTKRKRGQPNIAERFELYIHGMELANAYTELNDPVTQEATFRQQLAGLPEDDSMAKMDEDFIRALRHGMPPAGGLGIGIDRLVMLLTNTQTIRDVILFPLLRSEK